MIELITHTRTINVPTVLDVNRGNLKKTAQILRRSGFELGRVLVMSGSGFTHACAEMVEAELVGSGSNVLCRLVGAASHEVVARLVGETDTFGPDLLIGVGGGRVLDVAKRVARSCTTTLACIPTSLTHDGIGSPVASLTDGLGQRSSVPAAMPAAVIIDVDVIEAAPLAMLRAGVGDLLSNLSAVEDWQLADARGLENYDAYSAMIADGGARMLLSLDDLAQRGAAETLARGLILSGLAMETAGTSRPCSGAEHLISHSLDRMLGARARLHGEQVALGTLIAGAARNSMPLGLLEAYERHGLPVRPADIGLSTDQLIEAVIGAPLTRPDRYTILSEIDLSRDAVADLVDRAFLR